MLKPPKGQLSKYDETCDDTELIECAHCGAVLNGLTLWIIADTLETVCEQCYGEIPDE